LEKAKNHIIGRKSQDRQGQNRPKDLIDIHFIQIVSAPGIKDDTIRKRNQRKGHPSFIGISEHVQKYGAKMLVNNPPGGHIQNVTDNIHHISAGIKKVRDQQSHHRKGGADSHKSAMNKEYLDEFKFRKKCKDQKCGQMD
jgi:hypothetical protein